MAEDWEAGGFGLYLHWPFCAAKCPYCDFNSHVTASVDHDAWRHAFVSEIERAGQRTPGRVLHSIFFGGGTPSLMAPETVGAILETVHRTWPTANDLEVTLEANPTSVEAGKFADFRAAGVNRVSMGIQALNDPDLRKLGRMHSASEGLAAFDIARKTFDRVSFDLMYGRQDQSLSAWQAELTQALQLGLDHISLYQLTIEAGTVFGDRYKLGKLNGLPDDDLSADMYALTQDICADHDMPRYEVSNHATYGSESRHNKVYWRYGDYIGIGPGAHGRITVDGSRIATEQTRMPGAWLKGINRQTDEPLSGDDQAVEFLMMGLRLTDGIDPARYQTLSGRPLQAARVTELVDLGLLNATDHRLSVTNQGFSLLNAVLRRLLDD